MGGPPALGACCAASRVLIAQRTTSVLARTIQSRLVGLARAAERALKPQQIAAEVLTIEPHDLGDASRALRVRNARAARRVNGTTTTRRHVAAPTSQSARARERARESHRVGGREAWPSRGRASVNRARAKATGGARGRRATPKR